MKFLRFAEPNKKTINNKQCNKKRCGLKLMAFLFNDNSLDSANYFSTNGERLVENYFKTSFMESINWRVFRLFPSL